MATVGRDFQDYAVWMDEKGISRSRVKELGDRFTSQAFISTDLDDNQITLFHPGAMDLCHEQEVDPTDVRLGLISPEGRTGMIEHAQQMTEAGVAFLFDPGQGMPMFQKEDFLRFVEQATWAAFNGFEAELMQKKCELTIEQLAERLEAVVVGEAVQHPPPHVVTGLVVPGPGISQTDHDPGLRCFRAGGAEVGLAVGRQSAPAASGWTRMKSTCRSSAR